MRAGLRTSAAVRLNACGLLGLVLLSAAPVLAQVNLPPPPPPPIDNSGGSSGTSGSSGDNTPTQHKPKPHKPVEPAHTAAPPPTPPPQQHHENPPPPPPRPIEYETARTTSIRLNVLPLFVGRISADLEFMLAPHHALIISPNVTFHRFGLHRGDRGDVISSGMGFSDDNSGGFGGEIGYHYWLRHHLQGVYLGPSLVLGATIPPSPAKVFAYYGGAFDVGYQYLFANGFTLNGGGGIMVTGASGTTAHAAPRFLFGVGWSF